MFSIHNDPARLCDGTTRRELLRLGGLSLAGLTLPNLLRARETAPLGIPPTDKTFGRAKSVIFLYLAGGPPQHETFDPKPNAPLELRGPFNPISTNVPGIQFCELLPRTAAIADRLAVVRSMATDDNTHSSSSAWVLSGYKYVGPNARTIQPSDWPYFGSIVKRYKPSEKLPPLSTVWLPDLMRLNENVTPAGQTGGTMGRKWDPDRFIGNPADPQYQVKGLDLTDMPAMRLERRQSLLAQVERHFAAQTRGESVEVYDKFQQQAFDLLTSGAAREAFNIKQEPARVRERYGRNRWGQCVLLARRLVEAGVRLVHVQWPREPGDNAVDNPLWDTHAQNAERMEDVLAPQFDVGFSALVEDLDQRGLLDETLVVAIGEFGRTPKINGKGGRDHWGKVFSFAMAGAGISGGQVYGASDKTGGEPIRDRLTPGDLTASIFHLLGIDYQAEFTDAEGRSHKLTEGEPIYKLLGTEPATEQRVTPTGDLNRVPPYDENELLLAPTFTSPVPITAADAPSRPRGWRASSLLTKADSGLGVRVVDRQIQIGIHASEKQPLSVDHGAVAFLAQEVRCPLAGTYTLKVTAGGKAANAADFESVFLKHFTCRLLFYQYSNRSKKPTQHTVLHTVDFKPNFSGDDTLGEHVIEKEFLNPKPGSNFSFGNGMGVMVRIEKTSPGKLEIPGESAATIALAVSKVDLKFDAKKRNPNVTV